MRTGWRGGWSTSPEGRAHSRRVGTRSLRAWWARARCGAANRTTGKPCRNVALENGRCRLHGGLSPKGKHWHQTTWAKTYGPASNVKIDRKLKAIDRKAKRRAARLAAMTVEEQAAHEEWQRSHRPGRTPEQRANARRAREMRDRPEPPEPLKSAELLAVEAQLERIEKLALARVRAAKAEDETLELGAFG